MFCTATWFAVVSFSGKGIEHVLHRNQVCSGLILREGRVLNMFCTATWFAVVSFSGEREGIEHVLHCNLVCSGLILWEERVLNTVEEPEAPFFDLTLAGSAARRAGAPAPSGASASGMRKPPGKSWRTGLARFCFLFFFRSMAFHQLAWALAKRKVVFLHGFLEGVCALPCWLVGG